MTWDISIQFYGENFMPSSAGFNFTSSNDSGEIGISGRYINIPKPYGQAIIAGTDKNLIELCEIALELKNELFSVGATEIELNINRGYESQCNEELSIDELAVIAKLECHLSYSAYQIEGDEHA